jgi:hypothetical protein
MTNVTERKYQDIITCLRTSKPNWRPRLYSTTNPGGVGHEWYRRNFVVPYERQTESSTRFIPARVDDNRFTNPEYKATLATRTGWQKEAWYYGRWDIASGQYFSTFRPSAHILEKVDYWRAVEWFAAMDYGYNHYTVVLLGFRDENDNITVVDEHAERHWVPQRHVEAIKEMFARHQVSIAPPHPPGIPPLSLKDLRIWPNHRRLARFVAGGDVFGTESNGCTIW